MIDDVVLNKSESIERCIKQVAKYYAMPSDIAFNEDFLRQDAIALNLQRACEQAIDLANLSKPINLTSRKNQGKVSISLPVSQYLRDVVY